MHAETNGADGTEPQAVLHPLTGAAIFLVAVIGPDAGSLDAVRSLCGDMAGLVRAVGFRDPDGFLTCVTGIGHRLWDSLAGEPLMRPCIGKASVARALYPNRSADRSAGAPM